MSYLGRLLEAHLVAQSHVIMNLVPCVPHCSDERGWVTHRVVATVNDEEVGHISVSHIPRAVYDETLADREQFCRAIEGRQKPTREEMRRAAVRHTKFEKFHVGSVHVAYVSVEEGFRRQGIARKLYIAAAKWMAEEGFVLAASDLQRPEVKALWKKLLEDPAVPTVTTEDGRPAIDYN